MNVCENENVYVYECENVYVFENECVYENANVFENVFCFLHFEKWISFFVSHF